MHTLDVPAVSADSPSPLPAPTPAARQSFWKKLGGGSLSISIVVHAILLSIGVIWIFQVMPEQKPADIDFLPKGGGGGSPGVKEISNRKQRATMTPANAPRMAAKGASSGFVLPEPEPASAMTSLGSLSSRSLSGGLGGSGSGGGRGDGNGTGFGSGSGAGLGGGAGGMKPFAGVMFGNPVKARTIGVVLDVSGSMSSHLPKVIKELDRVAEGSPLVLYVGCGIGPGRAVTRTYSTMDIEEKRFERFWRLNRNGKYMTLEQGSAKEKVDFTTPLPNESLFRQLAARGNTSYVDYQGDEFAWTALLAKELRDVEAVYWFADFQDPVDEKEAKDVMYRLKAKRQKLYIHASVEGKYFTQVRDLIVTPTGGAVISTK
ncbi:hypothetical protein KBB96_06775 [Luteolibacter ambystomatis]|uniref:Uncharacterized protein n=1 Tax=Luteolibacter ambystomatis TaxID=2824561 RepID=A0A975J221_9BACT|nr:hypothetical protein [Luteolibacter ambystomatis]QUE52591.1 hypothetical protein KBB96_06775 [Luteolibacter ambystomatis]